jgi:hypothetical protein
MPPPTAIPCTCAEARALLSVTPTGLWPPGSSWDSTLLPGPSFRNATLGAPSRYAQSVPIRIFEIALAAGKTLFIDGHLELV